MYVLNVSIEVWANMCQIPGQVQRAKIEGDDHQFHRAFKATSWLQNFLIRFWVS